MQDVGERTHAADLVPVSWGKTWFGVLFPSKNQKKSPRYHVRIPQEGGVAEL